METISFGPSLFQGDIMTGHILIMTGLFPFLFIVSKPHLPERLWNPPPQKNAMLYQCHNRTRNMRKTTTSIPLCGFQCRAVHQQEPCTAHR